MMNRLTFEQTHKKLCDEFVAQQQEGESDQELGEAFIQFALKLVRCLPREADGAQDQRAVDRQTFKKLTNAQFPNPNDSLVEATFRRLRDPALAMNYIEQAVKARSAAQSRRASKERISRQDSITQRINELVEENPEISQRAVEFALKSDDDFLVDDVEVRCLIDQWTVKKKTLRGRLSRAKQRFKKKDSR